MYLCTSKPRGPYHLSSVTVLFHLSVLLWVLDNKIKSPLMLKAICTQHNIRAAAFEESLWRHILWNRLKFWIIRKKTMEPRVRWGTLWMHTLILLHTSFTKGLFWNKAHVQKRAAGRIFSLIFILIYKWASVHFARKKKGGGVWYDIKFSKHPTCSCGCRSVTWTLCY